jgi:hypothetical protein
MQPLIASSDSGAVAFIIIVVIIFGLISLAKSKKPKGKWVYLEQKKKGCLIMIIVFGVFTSLSALILCSALK